MKPPDIFQEVLFDFIKEMPKGVIRDNLTVKELDDLIEDFMERHGLRDA